MTRYWYHPESDSLFSAPDSDEPNRSDPLVEEIDEAQYRRLLWQRDEARWSQQPANLDQFKDLLG